MDFFYYQLSKLHQSEAKTLKFYTTCELFDIILLLRYYTEIDENSSTQSGDWAGSLI